MKKTQPKKTHLFGSSDSLRFQNAADRHETITTTMRYLHIADPQRHEAVSRHPINDILKQEMIHEER